MQGSKTFALCVALTFMIYLLGLNAIIANWDATSSSAVAAGQQKSPAPDHKPKPHWDTPISQKEQAKHAKKLARTWMLKKIDAPHSEWLCAKEIIHRESRWIPNLWNMQGSEAYGLGQVKGSFKYTKNKPLKQFKVALRYMIHKHNGACNSLDFHDDNGWY